MTHAVEQVEILTGQYGFWVTFRSEADIVWEIHGRVWHNPTPTSLRRLYRVISGDGIKITIEPDDTSPIIIATRVQEG
jgi:hypothetical protein